MSAGKLYLVSTPIGNLADITLRALEILKSVDLIAAEDTRRTGLLLSHYDIARPLSSYHDFNKQSKTPGLLRTLLEGKSIAVVSDAGTPGISDPAYFLVNQAIRNQIEVFSVPGATAFVSALIVSGLPTDRFVFEGFLPIKPGKKRKRLEDLRDEPRTLLFYESPHRLLKTMSELLEVFGERRISVSRELTKKFEETVRGEISQVKTYYNSKTLKGEFVLVVQGKQHATS
jgi:16S rRNA (cytidine1402-2'-O)-methyltransferase